MTSKKSIYIESLENRYLLSQTQVILQERTPENPAIMNRGVYVLGTDGNDHILIEQLPEPPEVEGTRGFWVKISAGIVGQTPMTLIDRVYVLRIEIEAGLGDDLVYVESGPIVFSISLGPGDDTLNFLAKNGDAMDFVGMDKPLQQRVPSLRYFLSA